MSDVYFEVGSTLAPEAVLEALRARGREWRESTFPVEFPWGVGVAIEGDRFRIWGGGKTYNRWLECVGTVDAAKGAGSTIRATLCEDRSDRVNLGAAFVIWLAFTALSLHTGDHFLQIFGCLPVVLMYAVGAISRELRSDEPQGYIDVLRDAAEGRTPGMPLPPASRSRSPVGP